MDLYVTFQNFGKEKRKRIFDGINENNDNDIKNKRIRLLEDPAFTSLPSSTSTPSDTTFAGGYTSSSSTSLALRSTSSSASSISNSHASGGGNTGGGARDGTSGYAGGGVRGGKGNCVSDGTDGGATIGVHTSNTHSALGTGISANLFYLSPASSAHTGAGASGLASYGVGSVTSTDTDRHYSQSHTSHPSSATSTPSPSGRAFPTGYPNFSGVYLPNHYAFGQALS